MKHLIESLFFIYDKLIYSIGLFFVSVVLHELYHFITCGGEFIAGIYFIENDFGIGVTHCMRQSVWNKEIVAYSISGIFLVLSLLVRGKSLNS